MHTIVFVAENGWWKTNERNDLVSEWVFCVGTLAYTHSSTIKTQRAPTTIKMCRILFVLLHLCKCREFLHQSLNAHHTCPFHGTLMWSSVENTLKIQKVSNFYYFLVFLHVLWNNENNKRIAVFFICFFWLFP